ncbi:DUF1127 domain-containing protein [Fuscovulum blasticum]|uniref:DUF1127 domain-containing protein n=1 Tax=Fuscovulum blasticum TaxID=1075 RepID=UPI000D3E258A|nr:DUF1127 domain-containing protein [Fuscovulum blasticum]AWD23335.1 hypothetical protein B6K69_05855 [Fuscovulum blasticum]
MSAHVTAISLPRVQPAARPTFKGFVAAALRRMDLQRQRDRLALLDARMLRDIGLSAEAAATEAARAVWNAPDHWQR